jgi:metallothionein
MADDKKCAHPACKCRAKEGGDFCSTYCEGVGETPDIECNCGHPECSATAKPI